MISAEEALEVLRRYYKTVPVGVEDLGLHEAHGRVLAEDIIAGVDVPGFDRAQMDGYAVRADDTFGCEEEAPVSLMLVGTIEPGVKAAIEIRRHETAEIATGAPIPKGANSVVMVEYTSRAGEFVQIYKAVVPGENVMAAGGDIMTGELVLKAGRRLSPREMGVAAALGLPGIRVYRQPRVAILSTGNEILRQGETLEFGKIYDINSSSLTGAVLEAGGSPIVLAPVPDDEHRLKMAVSEALSRADVVLTSGSTSAGAGDMIYRVLDSLGSPGVIVHGLTLKPGKPTVIAVLEDKPVIALPGYPTSALMIFQAIVRPILHSLSGYGESSARSGIEAKVAYRVFVGRGRREFLPVHLVTNSQAEHLAYPVEGGSGAITSLAMADGFIDIPPSREFLEEGESVRVSLFGNELRLADLVVVGSHCIGLDVLARLIKRTHASFDVKIVNVGSMGGLRAVSRGEADVAGTHLVDEATGLFNTPYLERMASSEPVVLIRGYNREQGLIVAPGNPKKINGLRDLLRSDVSLINRNPGSGTRILLEIELNKVASELNESLEGFKEQIKGYRIETKSHTAVAAAVAQGRADVGVGIRTVAAAYGLDFIHLADEHYDFAIPKSRLEKEAVKLFLKTLRAPEFSEVLRREAPGLVVVPETGSTTA